MGETANHEHPPQPQPTPPRPPVVLPPLGAARGPPFPPAEQLLHLHYCIHSNPPWPQSVLLAFQHYIVMLGNIVVVATLLVPRMGGGPGDKARVIQSLLFMSAINTLLQTWLGTRLPTVMGPSLAYLLSVLAIINDLSNETFFSEQERFLHTMRAIQGSLIVSSFVTILLGYSQVWGKFIRFLSPLVIVPVVCLAGLGLFGRGFPQLANCVEIGLPMLILLVISQQYLKNIHPITRPILEKFALLICVGLIWSFAAILTAAGAYNRAKAETQTSCRTDRTFLMSSAPWYMLV
ncbi:nucleobase-ascorbate transporter 3-like [Impatiens glandulifera]|uniref:nucleobase-ascorbate transporter 3-like n=1 Tax=Impatiens glandulifera TaxID=253017 RepID=UPI001FB115E2|nr:nucleobase-ascorbate transporter 3-like [Impatiens glandulifera]